MITHLDHWHFPHLIIFNFHILEVVGRDSETQFLVGQN